MRHHAYRIGAGRTALRERYLQTVFSAQQQCHFDIFRYFDVFGDNFVVSLVFPLCLLCFVSLTVSKLLQRKYKGKTRDMTKLSLKASKYRKLSRWHRCWAENTVWTSGGTPHAAPSAQLQICMYEVSKNISTRYGTA